MKKKILIALIVILALSVSVLAGCNLGIMSIELNSGSFEDVYYVGDTVSLSKAKIKVTKSDGTTENVNVTADMLSEQITTNEAGEKEYTITYEGKTTTFKIKVVNPTLSLEPNTVNYYVGDTVDLSAITVKVTKGEQSSNVTLTQEMLGGKIISTEAAGNFTFEVTHQGVKVNLTVNVVAPTIAIDTTSEYKTVYLVGETVDLTGVQLVVTKGTATTKVPVTAAMVEGVTEPLAKGSKTFTVKYLGATATFTVEARKVESIALENASLELIVGQPVPYADIKIIVKYEDIEQTEKISATEAMFGDSKINTSALTEQAVDYTITYQGKTATLSVTVINPAVESISVKTLKNVYYIGDAVDLTNAVLTVNFEGDTPSRDIPITAEMFGANTIDTSAVASNVEYTISFGGKTTTAAISVKDIAIVIGQFTTTYNQFDTVNNEATIKVVDAADNTVILATIPVTNEMLDKPVSTSAAGTTTYTVTYTKNVNVVRTVNVQVQVKAMVLQVEGLKLTYEYGETVSYSGNLKIKFEGSDEVVRTVPITEDMFGTKKISNTKVGDTVYTITYLDVVTVDVTIHVNPEKKPSVNSFEMPKFIEDYETKSATEDLTDANFKVSGAVYEVGNANKFIVEPRIQGFDVDGTRLSVSKGVHTIATFKVSSTLNGTYAEVEDLSELVTVSGNAYQFEQNANGKYVEMTISLDPNYYDFDDNLESSRTIKFVVVDNGYNVYDQAGLAVMNDYLKPEMWADILGCTVVNGQYVAGDNALTLEADLKPLYQYIGTVDWVILHGSININPDNLPEAYFWNGSETDYITWYNAAGQHDEPTIGAQRQAQMLGSLRDANADGPSYSYLISKNAEDDNNNKGLYSTTRVSISGNYNTIKIVEGIKEYTNAQGTKYTRRLIGVAHRNIQNLKRRQEVGNQWDVFSMMEPLNADNAWGDEPVTTFVIKNTAMTGNTGHNENSVYAGMEMLRFYAHEIRLENVVANKFHINFKQDNYRSEYDNIITLSNTKVYDTFNSMTFAWRGQINITNSILKDCGGPLFIMADGDNPNDLCKYPIVNVDAQSYLESYAMGNEAWYRELNSAVVAKFASLKAADAGMRQLFHKSFWTERTVNNQTNSYASLIAIMIPEAGTAFGDAQWAADGHVVRGEYNLSVSDTQTDTFGMQDKTLNEIIAVRDTNIFKSGNNYACQYELRTTGSDTQALLVSPELYKVLIEKEKDEDVALPNGATISAAAAYFNSDAVQAEFKAWCYQWATTSTNTLGLWMQGVPGAKYSPYLGIVFSNFNPIAE